MEITGRSNVALWLLRGVIRALWALYTRPGVAGCTGRGGD